MWICGWRIVVRSVYLQNHTVVMAVHVCREMHPECVLFSEYRLSVGLVFRMLFFPNKYI